MNTLSKLRTKAKLSQSELAALIGTSPGAVSHYENGRREISTSRLKKIIEALNTHGANCSANDFLNGTKGAA